MFLQFEILRNSTGLYSKIYPDYTDFKINIELKDTIYAVRYNPSGNIKIYKPTDFNLIKTILSEQKQAQIRITNGTFNQNFLIDLEQAFKEDLQIFIGKLEILDDYSIFETKKDDKINIMGLSSIGDVRAYILPATYYDYQFFITNEPNTFNTSVDNFTMSEYSNGMSDVLIGGDDASQISMNRDIVSAFFEITTNNGTDYNCNIYVTWLNSPAEFPVNYSKSGTISYSNFPTKTTKYEWYYKDVHIGNDILVYTRVRKFTDVIKFIVNKIDSSIQFDETGTINDSFYFLKTFESELLTFGSTSSNKPYKDLGIMHITDAIPNPDGSEKTDGATIGWLTFGQLFDFLKKLGFLWYLENRSGINYFRLIHYTEISNLNGSLNLNYYKGVDYTRLANNYEYDGLEYKKIVSEWQSNGIDFSKISLDFNRLNTGNIYSFADTTFLTDIDDIRTRLTQYSEESTDQFVLLCLTEESTNNYYIRDAFGKISRKRTNNSELSSSFIFENLLSQLPDNSGQLQKDIFIKNITFSDNRLQKRKKLLLTIPINQINSLSLQENVKFKGNWLEPEKIEVDCSKNQAKITLKDL